MESHIKGEWTKQLHKNSTQQTPGLDFVQVIIPEVKDPNSPLNDKKAEIRQFITVSVQRYTPVIPSKD